jgi:hypothetical protein
MSTYPFFRLNYYLSLNKSHRPIRQAFTKDVLECMLEQANNMGLVNPQGVQLLLKMGIAMGTFFIFHISLFKSGVINFTNLNLSSTYIST